jgi:hypothetical protein
MNTNKILKLIENKKEKARKHPDSLVRLSPGNYYFFSTLENELLIVSDDSYENGGGSEWVVRQDKNNNVVNEYPTLKSFKQDWIN